MQPINHHTIVTGHVLELVPTDYKPGIIKKVREAIDYALGETEPVALFHDLDPDVKFSFETFSGGGLKCTVYGKTGDPCIVFIVVKQANSIARQQYAALVKIDNGPRSMKSKMPEAPFCSVALTKYLEKRDNQKMLEWVGDYEGCAAVAWIYSDMIMSADEVELKEKIKKDLFAWLVFGTPELAPTPETIKTLGTDYLKRFIVTAQELVSKADAPMLVEGSAPMRERLERLLKMVE